MLIAQERYKSNIGEYILYMWQIEDILRGFQFNRESVEKNIISRFPLPDEQKEKVREWYFSLIQSMQEEKITQHGHLKKVQDTLNKLVEIHTQILKEGKDTPYLEAFQKVLPHIVSIRASAKENAKGEIETCFEELYGVLLLCLKHKEITSQTREATKDISNFLSLLSYRYHHLGEDLSSSSQK